MTRAGDLAVSAVQTQDALEDTQSELEETQKFIGQLETECATKEKAWAEKCKLRASEVEAISEAISILNDDNALDVFKKAVPSALLQDQVGFWQKSSQAASAAQKAQTILASASSKAHDQKLALLLFTLNSKLKLGSKAHLKSFEGVIKMIDDMISILGKDQADDEKQKSYCEDELAKASEEESAAKAKADQLAAAIPRCRTPSRPLLTTLQRSSRKT